MPYARTVLLSFLHTFVTPYHTHNTMKTEILFGLLTALASVSAGKHRYVLFWIVGVRGMKGVAG
jgi:hypothetical protein